MDTSLKPPRPSVRTTSKGHGYMSVDLAVQQYDFNCAVSSFHANRLAAGSVKQKANGQHAKT